MFWCAGSWNLTKAHSKHLDGIQRKMIFKMLRPRKKFEEDMEDFMMRMEDKITEVIGNAGIKKWSNAYLECYYQWAGSLAKTGRIDPLRPSWLILRYRDIQAILHMATYNKQGRQGHVGKVRIWRWETRIHQMLGDDWVLYAQDRTEWATQLEYFIAKFGRGH